MRFHHQNISWYATVTLVSLIGLGLVIGAFSLAFAQPLDQPLSPLMPLPPADYSVDQLAFSPPLEKAIIQEALEDYETIREQVARVEQRFAPGILPTRVLVGTPTRSPVLTASATEPGETETTPKRGLPTPGQVASPTPTSTASPSATDTPTSTPTMTPTSVGEASTETAIAVPPTSILTPTPTPRPSDTASATPVPTPAGPTPTPSPTPTLTPVPPTDTPTPVPPTDTPTIPPTSTPLPTETPQPTPTNTEEPYPAPTATAKPTKTEEPYP